MQNIYLIGMMGSGKTVTGKALAGLLKMDFSDLDEEIQNETRLSINEIFQKKGESFFRAEEKKILFCVSREKNTVVATGGGVILDSENVGKMKESGRVVYLLASFETLWERVREKRDRPLLRAVDPRATFMQLFQERKPLYESACDTRIPTDGLTAEAVAKNIAEKFLKAKTG
jgi:shikimate kinase